MNVAASLTPVPQPSTWTLLRNLRHIVRHSIRAMRATYYEERFWQFRQVADTLLPGYRYKWPYLDWWNDQSFSEFLCKFNELEGNNSDRHWTVYQMMQLVAEVPGDTAECGVYRGCTSYLICRRNAENSRFHRTHYLFDSFEGLSKPGPADGNHWSEGSLAAGEPEVRRSLAEFDSATVYVKGWIPAGFPRVPADRQFCFVHVDVDLYEPTLESVRFFYPRLSPGGMIICDDYGCSTCPGATRAMNEYFADKPEKIVSLCSGGGFVIKGVPGQRHELHTHIREVPRTTPDVSHVIHR